MSQDLPVLKLHLRLLSREGDFAMGPGKARLLAAIQETGSISAAGRLLGMSYHKTRLLVNELNEGFRSPLVAGSKGGNLRGGASLTELGREVLGRFLELEAVALGAIGTRMEAFEALLSPSAGPRLR
jgi:molybdate transport system regulatory protein